MLHRNRPGIVPYFDSVIFRAREFFFHRIRFGVLAERPKIFPQGFLKLAQRGEDGSSKWFTLMISSTVVWWALAIFSRFSPFFTVTSQKWPQGAPQLQRAGGVSGAIGGSLCTTTFALELAATSEFALRGISLKSVSDDLILGRTGKRLAEREIGPSPKRGLSSTVSSLGTASPIKVEGVITSSCVVKAAIKRMAQQSCIDQYRNQNRIFSIHSSSFTMRLNSSPRCSKFRNWS